MPLGILVGYDSKVERTKGLHDIHIVNEPTTLWHLACQLLFWHLVSELGEHGPLLRAIYNTRILYKNNREIWQAPAICNGAFLLVEG